MKTSRALVFSLAGEEGGSEAEKRREGEAARKFIRRQA